MAYWLFKSEPDKWSWDEQKDKGDVGEEWDGIRNYQARNNMRLMQLGDLVGMAEIGMSIPSFSAIPTRTPAVKTPSLTELRAPSTSSTLWPCPRASPRDILRDCSELQVRIKSPRPERPASVSGLAPMATPNR